MIVRNYVQGVSRGLQMIKKIGAREGLGMRPRNEKCLRVNVIPDNVRIGTTPLSG